MGKIIRDDIIAAGIDKRIKGIIEPKVGENAYLITRSLIVGYIKNLLEWSRKQEIEIEKENGGR